MNRTYKIWLIAAFVAFDIVLIAAVVVWLLRDPYRASQAQQAQVSEARQPAEGAAESDESLEAVPFETADLMFTGSSALGEQPGYFEKVSGEALLGPDDSLRRLRGTVEMASVLTQADSLTAKLKSEPGFFEVQKYPMAEFVSTEILPAPQGAVRDTHEIVGNLTLRGITRSIRFPARIEISPERFLLSAEFSVNRHDFGVSYEGGTAFPEIRDLVLINLDVDARRAPQVGGSGHFRFRIARERHQPHAMNTNPPNASDASVSRTSRRQFLAGGAALGIGSALSSSALASSFFVRGSETLRVGLIGCGGRGTGAAVDTLKADPATRIWAVGDLFEDRLETAVGAIAEKYADRCDLSVDRKFVGFDAYRKVIAEPVDMVILTTPPYFRPFHLAAAVAAGKHVFFEKPVAVDPAGIRQVIAAGREAKEKGLSCVVGTQRRHNQNYLEAMKAIHDGAIGDITGASVFWCQGGLWHLGREDEWSEVEYQIRNWLYFTWLSGDQIIEQHIHNIDVALWAFGDVAPEAVFASGGRTVRTDPLYGNVYDHMDCTFTMSDGRKIASKCRQWPGSPANWVGEEIYGTKGWARLNEVRNGNHLMDYKGNSVRSFDAMVEPYVQEHIDLIAAIRSGTPINDAERIANTNLAAIMGREAAFSGEVVLHDWALSESQLRLGPADCDELAFGDITCLPVAIPGEYKLT